MSQFTAMCLSIAIEAALVLTIWALARKSWPEHAARGLRLGLIAASVTLVTHPLAWNANIDWLAGWETGPRFLAIECSVSIVEGLLYHFAARTGWRLGLLLGVASNATSFGIGLLIFRLM